MMAFALGDAVGPVVCVDGLLVDFGGLTLKKEKISTVYIRV